ncbi:MAG: class I SAM-dependent methyltransferase [Thiomicrospira sp.]|uniref:class I SAM-dependent methyltransferase n=1 Tax=Thiomicrospira sp. TaxID=935 RepID=UPI001A02D56C|nr:class I SAM-dependent methyltransferase [Thiomicrospira sp.]MBE0493423.1 class I SAM-dependent methyltransferase [Thiomicrospira sp.]
MWNQKFDREDYLYGTEPNDFLRAASQKLTPNSNILCIAEGEGRNAIFLAKLGHQVTAVDASEIGLNKAQQLAKQENVIIQTLVADLAEFDMGQSKWDAIIAIFCHLPPTLRKQVHGNIVTALKSHGVFIAEAYSKKQLEHSTGGPKDLDLLMDLNEVKLELLGLDWSHATETQREILEGTGHTGIGEVIQLIGLKTH